MRSLHRRRFHDDVLEIPVPTVVREPPFAAPRQPKHCHRLLEPLLCLPDWNTESAELIVAIAAPNTEVEASSGEHVDRGDLLGEQQRVVQGSTTTAVPRRIVEVRAAR